MTPNMEVLNREDNIVTIPIMSSTHDTMILFLVIQVQLLSQYDNLVKLQEQLQLYCTKGCPPALTEYQKGMVGVGRFHGDRSWYRVMLKNTFRCGIRNGKMVKVRIINYN